MGTRTVFGGKTRDKEHEITLWRSLNSQAASNKSEEGDQLRLGFRSMRVNRLCN